MLLTVVPHRGSALSIQIIWQWVMWVREEHTLTKLCCLLGCRLPPQENHSKRNKLEGAKTLLHWPFALGVVETTTDHKLPIWKLTCIHSGRGSWIPQDWWGCWKQKNEPLFFSTRELPLKDPGAFQAHFSVVRWHHFWVQAYACHFTFIMEWPVQFQPAGPIPTLCFYPHLHKASGTHLQHHHTWSTEVKSCLILHLVSSFWIKPHLGRKNNTLSYFYIS